MTEPHCDLVLLSWNHLEETQACLESLFQETESTVPCRLFIVDNGSEPSVRAFLRSVKPFGAIQEVTLLQNESNEGFPRGMNRGIQASRAPYVCLLNNDLRFGAGWLARMLEVADAHSDIGVLNPTSSTFGNFPPRGQTIRDYIASLESKRGQYVEVGMCIGFCMVIRRELINRIGILSEEVERIFFEDEDYCMRAQQAGFQCVVVSSSYVYHAEHKTVRKMPEREALFQRNQRWCHEKWGRWLRVAYLHLAPLKLGSQALREWLEHLLGWARRRTHVYVMCSWLDGLAPGELFVSVGLAPHADIHWIPVPAWGSHGSVVWHVLRRQKKPFDAIIVPDERWARWMRRLGAAHHARVVVDDQHALQMLWQERSRSRL